MNLEHTYNFRELFMSGKSIIGITFNFTLEEIINQVTLEDVEHVHFKDCIFNQNELIFQYLNNKELCISFENCEFNCRVNFYNCKIKRLIFIDVKKINYLNLYSYDQEYSEYEDFTFVNGFTSNPIYELHGVISIGRCSFKNLRIEKIKHLSGDFRFYHNITTLNDDNFIRWKFDYCCFSLASFTNNRFDKEVSFKNVCFYNPCHINLVNEIEESENYYLFKNNYFENVIFCDAQFIGVSQFKSCYFNSKVDFSNLKNYDDGILLFSDCDFNGISYFNDCILNVLNFSKCSFKKTTVFNNSRLNKIFFIQVKFDNAAYFDYIVIKSLENNSYLKSTQISYWKITLRTIKQELQKTENKIDFNRFKSYELSVYYKELDWDWNSGFKDKFVLCTSKWSSNFGTSWRRAFAFTILSGIFWFLILYRIENTGSFKFEEINNFFNGLFRFFLITDFYNPLETDRIYLINSISWIPLILGKIFIAFGIYEMIQSFRKFKA